MVDVGPRPTQESLPLWGDVALGGVAGFHPAVAEWFRRRFPDGPTEPQRRSWPLIAARTDTLVAAPTGSGKTLAGFLVGIDALYKAHSAGQDVARGARVVYVSPLKALAVDIAENLQRPLEEIGAVAAELGLAPAPIRVAVRTGDTTASERAALVRKPPAFVVTTPESLYLLLTSPTGRQALRTAETVIVDEIHAVARDKRGAHLAVSLERLEALCDHRPVRVGLSATQRPIEVVGRLLVGARPLPAVVDVGHRRALDVALELPGGELEAVTSAAQMADVVERVASLVGEHRTTIVFVNTRRLAERLAHDLGERLGDDVVAAHHGSLSRERRLGVETRLRAGDLRALVATASLELGIDIGPVELVCQIGSPRSIATFLQRVGRSNHTRTGTPKGRVFPLTRDELVECCALLAAVRAGRLDAIVPARLPLDIAAQQLVAEVSAKECSTAELAALLRRSDPYRDLSDEDFADVVQLVTEGIQTGRGRRGAYLHHDRVNGLLRPRKGARLAAVTSGGAIPETGDYRVIAEPEDTVVGTVNEDWAVESTPGDIFLLGTHSWQIRRIEAGVVRVRDAGDTPPTVPFWRGEAPGRTAELSAEVSMLRATVDGYAAAGDLDGARRWLEQAAGVPSVAAAMVVDYLVVGRAALGAMPTQDQLVLERFFDDSGGMQLVVHSPYGVRINRGVGLALRKKFCRRFNFELQAAASDDAVVLSLGPHHSFPLDEVPRYLSSATLTDTLEHAILDSPMFQSRWRWNLNRSLLVLRYRGGRRNPPPIQRMESDDLLAAVFPQAAACQDNIVGPREIPDHLLVRQSIGDTLHEAIDADGVRQLIENIESGRVRVHCCDTTEASVLAHEIVTARPYAFLDDEEAQNRRTNAVRLRRGLQVDLATVGTLDPAAIDAVHAELAPAPETPDELHDLLTSAVVLTARPAWATLFESLRAAGRAQVVAAGAGSAGGEGGPVLWAAADRVDVVTAAFAGEDDACVRAVRGHLELLGVTTAAALAAATVLPAGRVVAALERLRQEGFAFEGRYTAAAVGGAGDDEWVARRLLARMHAYSRRARRQTVEPATAAQFMRFLLEWQHLAPGAHVAGRAGLIALLEQLQGWETAAVAWERELLARRMAHYDPAWVDGLCHAGETAWLRLTPRAPRPLPGHAAAEVCADESPEARRPGAGRGAGDGFERPLGTGRPGPGTGPSKATPISIVYRPHLPWLVAAARSVAAPGAPAAPAAPLQAGATAEVVAVLAERGACFAHEVAAAIRRLPTDIERALWDGVARGLVMCDGFEAIRAKLAGSQPVPRTRRFSAAARLAGPTAPAAGRWSLVPAVGDLEIDGHDLAEAVAEQLLQRWGVVFRELAARDGLGLPWRELQWALRRLEDRGLVRGGRWVAGFSGEQFALPEAAEALDRVRRTAPSGERVTVNATDPLNLVGLIVPGVPVPAVRTRSVTYLDGVAVT